MLKYYVDFLFGSCDMFFKHVRFLQFTNEFSLSMDELAAKLQEKAFKPCKPGDSLKIGWVGVFGRGTELLYASQGLVLITLATQEKIIPASVVKEKTEERIVALEITDGPLSKKRKADIKEDVHAMLLPQAFTRTVLTKAYIDMKNQLLVIEASSDSAMDNFTEFLRKTLGELPIELPKKSELSQAMTHWIISNDYPEELTMLDACTLQVDAQKNRATIKCSGYDLTSKNIVAFIKDGGRVVELLLSWNDEIDFTLTEDFTLKSIKFLDIIKNANNDMPQDTPADRLSSDFILMSESIGDLIQCLLVIFGASITDKTATGT